jgi:uncharacterized protein (TIGR02646 family)
MRKLARLPLSAGALAFLADRRAKRVSQAADPAGEAQRLWPMQDNRAFREIKDVLRQMASGYQNCMYCESGEATDIEHFWPKSQYPHKAYEWLNYLLACSNCNSNNKRDRFPVGAVGQPLLIDPTAEDPREHLDLLPLSGKYRALSPKGEHSIDVFGLGRVTLELARRDAWNGLQGLLVAYSAYRASGEDTAAADIRTVVCNHPFASLFVRMLEMASKPFAHRFLRPICLAAIQNHPELSGWL